MSVPINDGGPAFPHTRVYSNTPNDLMHQYIPMSGMTLRDYFAASTMAQLIAHKERVMDSRPEFRDIPEIVETMVAKAAYSQADAMLAERAKGEPK